MATNKTIGLLGSHATDVAIAFFAIGAVLGSSAWIVGAGLVAGTQVAARLARGELMSVMGPSSSRQRAHRA